MQLKAVWRFDSIGIKKGTKVLKINIRKDQLIFI